MTDETVCRMKTPPLMFINKISVERWQNMDDKERDEIVKEAKSKHEDFDYSTCFERPPQLLK